MKRLLNKAIKLVAPKKVKQCNEEINFKRKSVLIKVLNCGICSSDIKFIFKNSRIKKFPITLGHEISGEIESVGDKVKKFKKGQKIVLGAEIPCQKCFKNKSIENNLCNNPLSIGSIVDGGFAKYIILEENDLIRCPKIIYHSKKEINYICLSESVACVVNGLESVNFDRNKSILILGSGYMGLLFILISSFFKNKNIFIADYDKKRLSIAKKLKAKTILLTKNKLKNEKNILKKIKNLRYDIVISANSNFYSHKSCINFVKNNGYINYYGGLANNKKFHIDINHIHYKQIKLTGSFSSNQIHLNKAFQIIKKNNDKIRYLITSYANFSNFKKKALSLKKQNDIKIIFTPK